MVNRCKKCSAVSRTYYPYGKKWQKKTKRIKGSIVRKAQNKTKGKVFYETEHKRSCTHGKN